MTEYKFKVGDVVANSCHVGCEFEAEIVAIDSDCHSYPYLLRATEYQGWDFFKGDEAKGSERRIYPNFSDYLYYAWADESDIELLLTASKYNLKRTTFLEGVEL